MTDHTLHIDSICDLKVMTRHLVNYLRHLRAEVEPTAESADPLDLPADSSEVAVTGTGSSMFGFNHWTVQAYLRAHEDGSSITLRAVGDDTASRPRSARRFAPSLASSVKKMESLALLLRAMDSGTRRQMMYPA